MSTEGYPYLGASIGSRDYTQSYVDQKVDEWSAELQRLTKIVESQPHTAYSALTHGLSSRRHFVAWTIPDLKAAFQPLEDIICHSLLPALLGISPPNDSLSDLLALPPWWGGMGIFTPSEQCSRKCDASLNITEPSANCISTASGGHFS